MKINRSLLVSGILLTVILVLPCFGATGSCNGVSYNKDIYRCEYGELIGKCKGKDYYVAYDKCVNGVVVSGIAPSNNSGISTGNRGTFTDVRDGKTYKWVTIGSQVWMAENLNYNANGSLCYNYIPSYCDKYGRLYNWATAKVACPRSWHLPIIAEWNVLMTAVGSKADKYLKAVSSWNENENGEDKYGFSALPGGYLAGGWGGPNGNFYDVGGHGIWWSSTEYDNDYAYYLDMSTWVRTDYSFKNSLRSVRCVQD
ncbi:MAG: hypothetical protein LBC75_02115 [Fibromonadaceae bacterium]|jgi:uncharacterized protein (TIGR02145 family)|nr:hypothetical protein [Fibromonadaceae bacterium]